MRKDAGDVDGDVGPEGRRLLETVLIVEEDRILTQRRSIWGDVGHDDHVGGILNQDAGVAVVGVIVVGARRQDDVGVPLTNFSDYLQADVEGGH